MPFAVLRIQKLKTWGAIAASGHHNSRERDTPNADADRTTLNRQLVGSEGKNTVDAIKEVIGNQRIRKNAVLGVEMLLSASPEYFRPSSPEKAGAYDPARLQAWTQATTAWMQERYGSRIITATLHLDEATPHIHVLLVPLDDKGKLNCRCLFGGTRHTLSALQTDYAGAVASIGIGGALPTPAPNIRKSASSTHWHKPKLCSRFRWHRALMPRRCRTRSCVCRTKNLLCTPDRLPPVEPGRNGTPPSWW